MVLEGAKMIVRTAERWHCFPIGGSSEVFSPQRKLCTNAAYDGRGSAHAGCARYWLPEEISLDAVARPTRRSPPPEALPCRSKARGEAAESARAALVFAGLRYR